jgi:tripartite-type tricarboxylate transporter receptor subunit TctC
VSIAPQLQPELTKYKPEQFVPVAPVNQLTTVLVTRAGLGVKTASELVALAKKSRLTYASWGNGSLGQVAAEAFRSAAKIDLLNVPYQGAAPAAQAVLGGQVDVMFMPGPLWLSYHEKLVTLGATSPAPFHNVPSLTSQGVPVNVEIWQGILAPPKTPKPVVERLHRAFTEALDDPAMKDKTVKTGSIPLSLTQPEFARMVDDDIRKWKKLLVEYHIKPQ